MPLSFSTNLIKKKGLRNTKQRDTVLSVLTHTPRSVQEIADAIKKEKNTVDLASIYRALDLFVELGIARIIEIGDDKKRYELVDDSKHHHHLVCTNCSTIKDILINEDLFLKELASKTSFQIDHHHLEFFGLCTYCQHV